MHMCALSPTNSTAVAEHMWTTLSSFMLDTKLDLTLYGKSIGAALKFSTIHLFEWEGKKC